jgi:hypothetical protein
MVITSNPHEYQRRVTESWITRVRAFATFCSCHAQLHRTVWSRTHCLPGKSPECSSRRFQTLRPRENVPRLRS